MATKVSTLLIALAALAAASPFPTPPPLDENGNTPDECTMTLTRYTGTSIHLTRTLYAATETTTSFMNCGTCNNLEIFETRPVWAAGHGPVVTKTITVDKATTATAFRCRPTPSPRFAIPGIQPQPRQEKQTDAEFLELEPIADFPDFPEDQSDSEGCTSSLVTMQSFDLSPTLTVWPSFETLTNLVDCGGCPNLLVTRLNIGHGPQVFKTETVTAETASTTVEYGCLPTAEVTAVPVCEEEE